MATASLPKSLVEVVEAIACASCPIITLLVLTSRSTLALVPKTTLLVEPDTVLVPIAMAPSLVA